MTDPSCTTQRNLILHIKTKVEKRLIPVERDILSWLQGKIHVLAVRIVILKHIALEPVVGTSRMDTSLQTEINQETGKQGKNMALDSHL